MARQDGTDQPLDLARFREIVAALGADPARWPEDEQPAALALVTASDEARRLLMPEAALDDRLAAPSPPLPSDSLVRRLMAMKLAASPPRRGRYLAAAAVLAIAIATGVVLAPLLAEIDGLARPAVAAVDREGEILPSELALIDTASENDDENSPRRAAADDGEFDEPDQIEIAGLPLE